MTKSRHQDVPRPGRQASGRLSAQESRRLQRIVTASQDGYWEWDVANNAVLVSARWCAIVGVTPVGSTVTLDEIRARIHPGDLARIRSLFERMVADPAAAASADLEHRFVRDDGRVVWVLARGAVTRRDAQGRAELITGVLTDISTSREKTEDLRRSRDEFEARAAQRALDLNSINRSLTENEQKYRLLFDTSPDAVLFFRADNGRLLAGNGAALALYGYTEQELLQRTIYDITAEPGSTRASIGKTVEDRLQRILLLHHRKRDGAVFPVEISAGTFVLDGHQIVCGIIRDIGERMRAEARLDRLARVQSVLGGVNHAIAHCEDRPDLLDAVCRIAVRNGGFRLAWVGLIEPDGTVKPVAASGETGYLKGIRVSTSADHPSGCGPVGVAIRENRPVVIDDIEADDRMVPWHRRARRFGLRYVAAFPLRMWGRVIGAFQVYAPVADFFDPDELELLTQISDDLSFALASIESERERRRIEVQLSIKNAALAAAANGIVITGVDGTIIWANDAFTAMTGYAFADVQGRNPRVLKSGRHDATFYRTLWETILSGRVWRGEVLNRRKNGELYAEEMTITPVRAAAGDLSHFIAIKQDIGERKRMEHEILTAREREQERIGRDLHDGLCQVLTGAKFRTGLLGQKLQSRASREVRDAVAIERLLDQAIEQARGLAYGLNPVRLEASGLAEALEQLAMSVSAGARLHCVCSIRRNLIVEDRNVAIQLFRIAQEAVQNALKHSRAKRVVVSLRRRAGALTLSVTDDGIGISAAGGQSRGVGLHNMRIRAESIGAALTVEAAETGGTVVSCRVRLGGTRKGGRP